MLAVSLTLSEHSQPPLTLMPVSLVTVTKEILASKTTLEIFDESSNPDESSLIKTYLECMSISGAMKQISGVSFCLSGILF